MKGRSEGDRNLTVQPGAAPGEEKRGSRMFHIHSGDEKWKGKRTSQGKRGVKLSLRLKREGNSTRELHDWTRLGAGQGGQRWRGGRQREGQDANLGGRKLHGNSGGFIWWDREIGRDCQRGVDASKFLERILEVAKPRGRALGTMGLCSGSVFAKLFGRKRDAERQ